MTNLMDIEILRSFLQRKKLKFKIGPATIGDGNCLIDCLFENIKHFKSQGLWTREVPSSFDVFRANVVEFMKAQKHLYLGYTNEDGIYNDGTHTEATFKALIDDQSKPYSYCDEEGFFVSAACQYLDVELIIVITSIDSPIIPDGTGGPIQRINSGQRLKFCAGLIRDEVRRTGHYQFIYENDQGEEVEGPEEVIRHPGNLTGI